MPIRRFILLTTIFCLTVPLAFASKPDKAQIEADVRAAMGHTGYRDQPLTVEAEIRSEGFTPSVSGKYRLFWKSAQDWFERIDVGPHADLTIGKGEHIFHKANPASADFWTVLFRNAFNAQTIYLSRSQWKLDFAETKKVDGVLTECATFKRGDNHFKACVDASTKDLLSVDNIRYSRFESLGDRRYPRHFEFSYQAFHFIADITTLAGDAKVPAAPTGMDEQPNCTSTEVTGGELLSKVAPQYPQGFRITGKPGIVFLLSEIRPDGSVEVKDAFGADPAFNDAATAAVNQWRYSPVICRGVTVPVENIVTINFWSPPSR